MDREEAVLNLVAELIKLLAISNREAVELAERVELLERDVICLKEK